MSHDVGDADFHRDLLESVTETSPDLIYFKDAEHRLVHVGRSYADIFDAEPEELVGKTARDLFPEEAEEIIADEKRALRGEEIIDRERLVTHPDGSEHWYSIYKMPRYDDEGNVVGFFANDRDVTERKRLQQRLSIVNRILRHDIRSAVSIIRGNARLANSVEDEQEEVMDTIEEEAERLYDLSENARYIEEALSGNGPGTERVDLVSLLQAKLFRLKDTHSHVSISSDLPESAMIVASVRLGEALDNVLGNAVVHNDRETPEVAVEVSDRRLETGMVDIRIADNGPGIPKDELEPIRSGVETALEHSSGLGLWVVKWIVEESGGELAFEENEPRGSTVVISLPAP